MCAYNQGDVVAVVRAARDEDGASRVGWLAAGGWAAEEGAAHGRACAADGACGAVSDPCDRARTARGGGAAHGERVPARRRRDRGGAREGRFSCRAVLRATRS